MSALTVGSLFSGIGGLDLGLERAGMEVRWQCEIDPYCRKVLKKHWPHVPCYEDVRSLPDDIERVDLICGGYPCQPFSLAGARGGIDDPRHLWPAFADTLRLLRPSYALLENVAGHLSLGFDGVLGDLASLGYDAEWTCIPAAAVGAPHLRWRLFVLAYANEHGEPGESVDAFAGPRIVVPDAMCAGGRQIAGSVRGDETADEGWAEEHSDLAGGVCEDVADTWCEQSGERDGVDLFGGWEDEAEQAGVGGGRSGANVVNSSGQRQRESPDETNTVPGTREARQELGGGGWWTTEPNVGRVADGVPSRVDRLRALGNAVVPQVAEFIGTRLLETLKAKTP